MRGLRQFLDSRPSERDAAMEALLRGRKPALGDADLRAAIAGAWRRIEQERLRRPPMSDGGAWHGLRRLLVPSMALACFLVGLCIGLSLEANFTYESALSDLASHPILAEFAP